MVVDLEENESLQSSENGHPSENKVAFSRNDVLICSVHGNIHALHKSDGSRIWKVRSPSGAMGGVASILVAEEDRVLVGANGKTSCVDLLTGETLWTNKMLEVSIVTTPKKKSDSNVGQAETVEEVKQLVISCSRGKVMAIDVEFGRTVWTYNCPGVWFNIPVAIVELALIHKEEGPSLVVYIGAGQWVYCLKAMTGEVIWSSRISDAKPALNYMTLATLKSCTAFSQNPVAQVRNTIRHKDRTF